MSRLILGIVILFTLAGCTKGPTDEQMDTLVSDVNKLLTNKEQSSNVNDSLAGVRLQESAKDFDLKKMELYQLMKVVQNNTLANSKSVQKWMAPLLAQMAQQSDKAGAVAFYYQLCYGQQEDNYENTLKLLQHPGLPQFINDDSIPIGLFVGIAYSGYEPVQNAEMLKMVMPLINSETSVNNVMQGVWIFDMALKLEDEVPAEELNKIREKILAQYQRILPLVSEKLKEKVESDIIYLNSLIAQRKLIGSEAPDIDFIWTSKGGAKKLSDLKGKVVIVDFWATWCGPCVKAFPNVRELQKRYKEYPVEIVGVTSLQGFHIDRNGEKPAYVDTKGNPEQEYTLMKEFVKGMDMPWTVAFSSQNVMNPEYGVKGIPHIAIIDTEGRVRHNALNPNSAPHEEAEKIDALLKEAGLKYPAKPMEETNYAK